MKNKFSKSLISSGIIASMVLTTNVMSFGAGLEGFTPKNTYSQGVFKDIKKDNWFYKDVTKAYELGLVSGKGNNIFNPAGKVTIAEAITLATNINSQYTGETVVNKDGKWYESSVEYAKKHGIIKENELTNYEKFATRSEVAYILSKSLPEHELNNINKVDKIPDLKSSDKYSSSIFKLYNSGIIRGIGTSGEFKPNDYISRAEIASLVNRLVKPENRVKFELEDILYKNDKYGFTMTIPRIWGGKYKITSAMSNGHEVLHFDLMKNGQKITDLFVLEMISTKGYNPDQDLHRRKVGINKGYAMMTYRSHDTNEELIKPENIDELNLYFKMMNEDYDKILKSVKFY